MMYDLFDRLTGQDSVFSRPIALRDMEAPAFFEPRFEGLETRQLLNGSPGWAIPPTSLSVSEVCSSAITLEWTQPGNNADGYLVEWYVNDGALFVGSMTVTGGGALEAKITGLLPDTDYSFVVYVTAAGGQVSANSLTAAATTDVFVLEAPATVSVSDIGHDGLTLTWSAVPGASGYRVEWNVTGGPIISYMLVDSFVHSVEITSLQSKTEYSFRVYTIGEGLVSAESAATSATTDRLVVPAPTKGTYAVPRKVKAKADGACAIILTWKPPKVKSVPNGYKVVSYHIYDAAGNRVATVNANEGRTCRIDGLIPKTRYRFRVVAVYQHRNGGKLFESNDSITTRAKTASKPSKPKIVSTIRGTTSITFYWKAQPEERFDVQCFLQKQNITAFVTIGFLYEDNDPGSGKIIGVQVSGLAANAKYNFTIQAVNDTWDVKSKVTKKSVRTLR